MARPTAEILADIDAFQPVDRHWRLLGDLLAELWSVGVPAAAYPVLLRIFDRFPDEDGASVFWSVVHGLESLPDYEPALRASAEASPAEFKQLMLDRIQRSRA